MTDWIKSAAPILFVVAAGVGVLMLALAGLGFFADQAEGGETVVTTAPNPQVGGATPMLGAATPAGVETATFALG